MRRAIGAFLLREELGVVVEQRAEVKQNQGQASQGDLDFPMV